MPEDAESLLGTIHLPPHYKSARALGRRSKAYYSLNPYPNYSPMTKDWISENRGPYPRCRPLPEKLIDDQADWLFGDPVTFRCSDKETDPLTELINEVWTSNNMTTRMHSGAVCASNTGGVVLKFSYDETRVKRPIQIDILDPTEQVYLYWSQEVMDLLLMARIQYPVYNAATGQWYWHREEYTDKTHRIYKDVAISEVTSDVNWTDPFSLVEKIEDYQSWQVESQEVNEFGIIPVWYSKNRDTGTEVGKGDLWTLFEHIDQINFTHNISHTDNQKSIDPGKAYIDLTAADGDQPSLSGNAKIVVVESTDADKGSQGKIQEFSSNAAVREHVDKFAYDLEKEVYSAAGWVDIDSSEVTNKGNLTVAVLTQLYAPCIKTITGKRQTMGEDGICVFLERMSEGLTNLGVPEWSIAEDVQPIWQPFFEESEEEKLVRVQRVTAEMESFLTTHDRAVREVASANGITDVDTLLEEVAKEKEEAERKEQEQLELGQSQMNKQRLGVGGGKKDA